jgi:PEP-CTERM motif-containing protein
MLRRIIPICMVAAIAMIPVGALADPITITHTQTTLGEETLGQIPNPGPQGAKNPVSVTITNNTGKDWEDYTIRIVSPSGSTLLLISSFTLPAGPFESGSRSKDKLSVHYTDGTVPDTQSFTADLVIAYVDTSVTVYGTPSVESAAPEPSTLLLWGAGLLGWATLMRRRG